MRLRTLWRCGAGVSQCCGDRCRVWPVTGAAAQMAHIFHGTYLIIINKGKMKLEGKADLVFHEKIGEVMGRLRCDGT